VEEHGAIDSNLHYAKLPSLGEMAVWGSQEQGCLNKGVSKEIQEWSTIMHKVGREMKDSNLLKEAHHA
jgi:hypothetical protein